MSKQHRYSGRYWMVFQHEVIRGVVVSTVCGNDCSPLTTPTQATSVMADYAADGTEEQWFTVREVFPVYSLTGALVRYMPKLA